MGIAQSIVAKISQGNTSISFQPLKYVLKEMRLQTGSFLHVFYLLGPKLGSALIGQRQIDTLNEMPVHRRVT